MDTKTEQRRAYVDALLQRLRRQYVERRPLPRPDDTKQPLSLPLLQRLYRCVISEGYGE
jgi:hypothetical protein